jgi:adenylate cyclase class 2
MTKDALEIEIKFYIADPEATRMELISLGATSHGRVFERNICFEDTENTFKARDILLRLRQDDGTRLTFKSPPPDRDPDFKVYEELEISVDDFDTCLAILKHLGFRPERRYEKWRETFLIDRTQLLRDTTPCGTFLEIEGDKTAIATIAAKMGFDWSHRILLNYLEIFDIINTKDNLGLYDMTFESFESLQIDVSRHLSDFRVS